MNKNVQWMKRAIELAQEVKGSTFPNPAVGAVLVKEDTIIAEGATQPAGGAHAEVVCLQKAGRKAQGADLYVTLEPCSHFGKTPPCTDAIIAAGIKRVFVAVGDPNPLVNGKGITILQEKGILVESGLLCDEARKVNVEFFKFIVKKMPYITIKYAMTLDGKIACDSGDSKWISGPESREVVHKLRKETHAIMVGSGTLDADDPELTCRLDGISASYQPVRILLSSSGRISKDKKLIQDGDPTLLVTTENGADRLGALPASVKIAVVPDRQFSMRAVFEYLYELQIVSVIVEGGTNIFTSIIKDRLFDKVVAFVAPVLCGGARYSPLLDIGIGKMKDAMSLTGSWKQIGQDIYFEGYPQ